jgi:serine protease Do
MNVTVRDSGGRERDITLSVEDLPSLDAARVEVIEGLELITLTPAIQAERGLRYGAGALIAGVSDQVNRSTGLSAGDLIVQINRSRIESAEDAAEILQYLASRRADVMLIYERSRALWRTYFRVQ